MQKLQEEFAAEMATLRGQTDLLEARATELEANQFSTTTKLSGFTVFGIQGRTPNRADRAPQRRQKGYQRPPVQMSTRSTSLNYI